MPVGGKGDQRNVSFVEHLRRLSLIDEGYFEEELGLDPRPVGLSELDPKTAALVQVAASVAIGSSAVCVGWSTSRAMAEGATEDEVADVLLAILPVVGLGRVVTAAPDVAAALGDDVMDLWDEPPRH